MITRKDVRFHSQTNPLTMLEQLDAKLEINAHILFNPMMYADSASGLDHLWRVIHNRVYGDFRTKLIETTHLLKRALAYSTDTPPAVRNDLNDKMNELVKMLDP